MAKIRLRCLGDKKEYSHIAVTFLRKDIEASFLEKDKARCQVRGDEEDQGFVENTSPVDSTEG